MLPLNLSYSQNNMSKEKSVALQRRVESYPRPANFKFIVDYASQKQISKSEAVNEAIQALKEKVSTKQKHDY